MYVCMGHVRARYRLVTVDIIYFHSRYRNNITPSLFITLWNDNNGTCKYCFKSQCNRGHTLSCRYLLTSASDANLVSQSCSFDARWKYDLCDTARRWLEKQWKKDETHGGAYKNIIYWQLIYSTRTTTNKETKPWLRNHGWMASQCRRGRILTFLLGLGNPYQQSSWRCCSLSFHLHRFS